MIIGTQDYVLGFFYFLLVLIVAFRYRPKGALEGTAKYYRLGLLLKVVGAIALGLIYQYYYQGGDTLAYYAGGQAWTNYFLSDPGGAIEFLISGGPADLGRLRNYHAVPQYYFIYDSGPQEIMVIKFAGVLNLLGGNTYTTTAILFALFAFPGQWAMYKTFLRHFPGLRKEMAWAVLFIPSVVFWGAGILKDTITFAAIGWLVFAIDQIFLQRKQVLWSGVLLAASFYLIATIKGYIFFALIPGLVIWLVNSFKSRITSSFLRIVIGPFVFVLAVGLGVLLIGQISESLGRYSLENIEGVAAATQEWHTIVSEDGSGYSLGPSDLSATGMLTTFPAAVNVTLFRPYLWEVSGVVVLFTALESLAVLLLTLHTFLSGGLIRVFRIINRHPFIQFCLIFSIILAFAAGFTAYNFGALARYKIPLMPFYVGALFMIRYLAKNEKAGTQEVQGTNTSEA